MAGEGRTILASSRPPILGFRRHEEGRLEDSISHKENPGNVPRPAGEAMDSPPGVVASNLGPEAMGPGSSPALAGEAGMTVRPTPDAAIYPDLAPFAAPPKPPQANAGGTPGGALHPSPPPERGTPSSQPPRDLLNAEEVAARVLNRTHEGPLGTGGLDLTRVILALFEREAGRRK